MAANLTFLRFTITVSVSVIYLFFKIKDAKVCRVYKRQTLAGAAPESGATDAHQSTGAGRASLMAQHPTAGSQSTRAFHWRRSLPYTARNAHAYPERKQRAREFAETQPPTGATGALLHRPRALAQPPSGSEYIEQGARSRLPQVDAYLRFYHRLSQLANWYLLIKNILVCLFRHEALARWRYLDCYVLGRFIVNGRVIEVAAYCGCYLILMRIIWRMTMTRKRPEFRMPCIEFLLTRSEHEPYWSRDDSAVSAGASGNTKATIGTQEDGKKVSSSSSSSSSSSPPPPPPQQQQDEYSALLEFWNHFEAQEVNTGRLHRVRPNRTREAWDTLAHATARYFSVFFIIWFGIIFTFVRMGLPVVLTRRGFAYSYRHCIQWIMSQDSFHAPFVSQQQQQQQQHQLQQRLPAHEQPVSNSSAFANSFYNFYLSKQNETCLDACASTSLTAAASPWPYLLVASASTSVAAEAAVATRYARPAIIQDLFPPFTDLVSFNYFHLIRIGLELAETVFVYVEAGLHFSSAYYMALIMSHDISLYCRAINARLERLIGSLRQASSLLQANVRRNNYYDLLFAARNTGRYGQAIKREMLLQEMEFVDQRAETTEIQAMIADLFDTIDSYNKYISLQNLCLIMAWFGYSALVSSWIFLPGNESPKTEWYFIHIAATIYVFISLASMSGAATSCLKLYNLITVAMALDANFKSSKSVWVSLLKFYSPRPLYCFTIMSSIEITYLLGIKLVLWLFSALIVASSFFQVYNIK